jgi:hypothetical protein
LFGKKITHVIEVLFKEEFVEFFGIEIGSSAVALRIGAFEHVYFFDTGQNDLILIFLLIFP